VETISFDDFLKVDIRLGEIVHAELRTDVKKPAFLLKIDFGGELGIKKTSAQLVGHYTPETLRGLKVLAVVNFPPKQVGKMISEVLILGVSDEGGAIVLVTPQFQAPLGARLH